MLCCEPGRARQGGGQQEGNSSCVIAQTCLERPEPLLADLLTCSRLDLQLHGKPDSWKNLEQRQEQAAAKV